MENIMPCAGAQDPPPKGDQWLQGDATDVSPYKDSERLIWLKSFGMQWTLLMTFYDCMVVSLFMVLSVGQAASQLGTEREQASQEG